MTQSVHTALKQASQILVSSGVAAAQRDAKLLMAFVLGFEPHQVSLHRDAMLDVDQQLAFMATIKQRASRVPISHILGYRDFFENRFILTPDVLDPRPETEQLVSHALCENFESVLDLGTGSGCILLSLLAKRPLAHGIGVDQSVKAIAVAKLNAQKLHLSARVKLMVSNWFSEVPMTKFDLIVSNPPYIHPDAMAALSAEVLHEPEMALTDHNDGLSHYLNIAKQAHDFLTPNGRLIFEIGFDQGAAVSEILSQQKFYDIIILDDLNNHPRVVACRASDL
jgi:release factor glutamine methyltransferase